jgi:O-antigen ligase
MGDKLQNDGLFSGWRKASLFLLLCFMMASAFFLPRAFLSAAMILFILISFLHARIKQQLATFIRHPLLWSMSLLFFLPLLSGLWSSNQDEWLSTIRIKLPLLFMPLAFASPFRFSEKDWQNLALVFVLLVLAAAGWSMVQYLAEMKSVHEGYLRSNMLRTPLENDHVRFSWAVQAAVLCGGILFWKNRSQSKIISGLMAFSILCLVVYLHILAARTGLLCFYVSLFILFTWLLLEKTSRKYALLILFFVAALPLLAYHLLPTFQNRVKYFRYDFPYFSKAHYLENTNDAVRVISWKAGWQVMQENPLTGTGFGDVKQETREWYGRHYPQMNDSDKILPASQWLLYGAGLGWPGFIMAILITMLPLTVKNILYKLTWYMLSASVMVLLVFDAALEIQFGVFLYSAVLLWWWKWMQQKT